MIEGSTYHLDINWRVRLLKRHKTMEELAQVAEICFRKEEASFAKELIDYLVREGLIQDFLEQEQNIQQNV